MLNSFFKRISFLTISFLRINAFMLILLSCSINVNAQTVPPDTLKKYPLDSALIGKWRMVDIKKTTPNFKSLADIKKWRNDIKIHQLEITFNNQFYYRMEPYGKQSKLYFGYYYTYYDGCNTCSCQYLIDRNKIIPNGIFTSTLRACKPSINVPVGILRGDTYLVNGDKLSIISKNYTTLYNRVSIPPKKE